MSDSKPRRWTEIEWLDVPITQRLLGHLVMAQRDGVIPDLELQTVRRVGPAFWLRLRGFGKVTLRELTELVGGWP